MQLLPISMHFSLLDPQPWSILKYFSWPWHGIDWCRLPSRQQVSLTVIIDYVLRINLIRIRYECFWLTPIRILYWLINWFDFQIWEETFFLIYSVVPYLSHNMRTRYKFLKVGEQILFSQNFTLYSETRNELMVLSSNLEM